jgi:hypothetical protein
MSSINDEDERNLINYNEVKNLKLCNSFSSSMVSKKHLLYF